MKKYIKLICVMGVIGIIGMMSCKKEKTTEADTQPPSVNILSPVQGQELKQRYDTIEVEATDNKEMAKLELYIDNQLVHQHSAPGYQAMHLRYVWDLTGYTNRSTHTIYAKGYDASNNVGTSSTITVKVINRDTLEGENNSAEEIPDGGELQKIITISGAPQGAVVGYVKVQINIDDYYADTCLLIWISPPDGVPLLLGDDSVNFPVTVELPEQFAGKNPNGNWTLIINDQTADGDVEGKFLYWKIWVEWKF